jgi:Holliday junction resolvase RusA-like endonuclease
MGGNDGTEVKGRRSIAVIPFLPPSVNSLYNVIYSQRRVEKKPEIRLFCYRAKEYLRAFPLSDGSLVRLDLVFAYPFDCKNGKLRRKDSQNMMKVIADLVAEKGGWDDSRIKSGSWESVDSENESVTITLSEIVADAEHGGRG